jgi:hypothetical protein
VAGVATLLHLTVAVLILPRGSPPPGAAEPAAVSVVLVRPTIPLLRTARRRAGRSQGRAAAVEGPHAQTAVGPPVEGSVPAPNIDERWRLPPAAWQAEEVRQAIRRTQLTRLCWGLGEGVLSLDEKAACDRYWTGQRRR